jgi:hypothetical protein
VVFSNFAYELFNPFTVENNKTHLVRRGSPPGPVWHRVLPEVPLEGLQTLYTSLIRGPAADHQVKTRESMMAQREGWLRTQDPAHPEVAWARVFIATCLTAVLT